MQSDLTILPLQYLIFIYCGREMNKENCSLFVCFFPFPSSSFLFSPSFSWYHTLKALQTKLKSHFCRFFFLSSFSFLLFSSSFLFFPSFFFPFLFSSSFVSSTSSMRLPGDGLGRPTSKVFQPFGWRSKLTCQARL